MAERLNLKGEEKVIQKLRSLYSSYGYRTYKMSRFEEYDLYAQNKDFLVSGNIITFTDTDGTLMALKPDVTLSIVKSLAKSTASVSRVCYDENVYRVSDRSGTFREIMQAGLECIGNVGPVELSEVAILAQKSLEAISGKSVLTISHMGIVEAFVSEIADEEVKAAALKALSNRNVSALEALARDNEEYSQVIGKLAELAVMAGDNSEVFSSLRAMGADEASLKELEGVVSRLDERRLRIDFSVLGEMNYYNGITFRGYVEGVPVSVISGGQYDRLMARMGRKAKAVGFAVYMDALERLLSSAPEYDADTVLVYGDSDDPAAVLDRAEAIRKEGKSVVAMKEVPFSFRYREVVTMGGAQNA